MVYFNVCILLVSGLSIACTVHSPTLAMKVATYFAWLCKLNTVGVHITGDGSFRRQLRINQDKNHSKSVSKQVKESCICLPHDLLPIKESSKRDLRYFT